MRFEIIFFLPFILFPILICWGILMYRNINNIKNTNNSDKVSYGDTETSFFLIAPIEYIYLGITKKNISLLIQGTTFIILFILSFFMLYL